MIFDSFLRPLKEVSHRNYYRSRSAVCPRSLLVKARTPANQEPPGQAGGRSLGRIFFFLTNKYNHSLFKPIRERTKFHNRRWTYRSRWSRKKKWNHPLPCHSIIYELEKKKDSNKKKAKIFFSSLIGWVDSEQGRRRVLFFLLFEFFLVSFITIQSRHCVPIARMGKDTRIAGSHGWEFHFFFGNHYYYHRHPFKSRRKRIFGNFLGVTHVCPIADGAILGVLRTTQ